MNLEKFIEDNFDVLEECYYNFLSKIPMKYKNLINIDFLTFSKHLFDCYKLN